MKFGLEYSKLRWIAAAVIFFACFASWRACVMFTADIEEKFQELSENEEYLFQEILYWRFNFARAVDAEVERKLKEERGDL